MPPKSKTFVCEQHANNISREWQTFYRDQLFFDITLTTKTDNLKLHAHRAVLSASSDYFLEMLGSTLKEARSLLIELGIDGATLKLVVDFMYGGTIDLHSENVTRLLTAADVLKINTLKVACIDFIGETLDVTNCLSVASLAKHQQSTELHEMAFEFALQHFEEVCKTEEFLQLTEEQLSELISSDYLCVNSEETVYESVMSWVKHDRGYREKSTMDLMSQVLESKLSRTKLSKRHSEEKKANDTKIETLGFISGWTSHLKLQTLNRESYKWSCENIPPPHTVRNDYKAMVIDKKLIFAGGRIKDVTTNIVECLDIKTKEWSNLPPMRQARRLPGMAELNGDLYVVGGRLNRQWLRSVEKYDFRTCKWQVLASMHSEHEDVSVTVLGELLYAGSSSIECFNPAKNEWTQLPHKNERFKYFRLAGVGGHLYAVGGLQNGQKCKTVERFHPSTNTWTVITPGLELALRPLECVSWNNRLIVCGGYHDEGVNNSVWEYDPEENEWKTLAPLLEYVIYYASSSLFTFTK